MITLQDCIGMSGLDPLEICAIAEHEHVPQVIATELGWMLAATPAGKHRIAEMIEDDIAVARMGGHNGHARELREVLTRFRATHRHCLD